MGQRARTSPSQPPLMIPISHPPPGAPARDDTPPAPPPFDVARHVEPSPTPAPRLGSSPGPPTASSPRIIRNRADADAGVVLDADRDKSVLLDHRWCLSRTTVGGGWTMVTRTDPTAPPLSCLLVCLTTAPAPSSDVLASRQDVLYCAESVRFPGCPSCRARLLEFWIT